LADQHPHQPSRRRPPWMSAGGAGAAATVSPALQAYRGRIGR
jgi:hypothetical protein